MKIFLYKCRQGSEIIEGYIQAESVADASRKLETKGFIVLQIKMYNMGSSAVALQTQLVPFSFKEKKDFYTSFYRQYKAGIPLVETLNSMMSTGLNNNVKSACFSIVKRLQAGETVEKVFSLYSKYIGKTESALVIAGESSGQLDDILKKIVENIKQQEKIKNNVISKATYPAIVICIAVLSAMIFFFIIFPIFNCVIEGEDIDAVSLLVFGIIKIILSFAFFMIVVIKVMQNRTVQNNFIAKVLNLKFLEEIMKKFYLTNFFMSLSLAQEAGLAYHDSVSSAKHSVNMSHVVKKIETTERMLKNGCNLTTAFAAADIFSEYAISQISTAEVAGETANAFSDISNDYRESCMLEIDTALKFLGPLLLGCAGIIVAVVAAKFLSKYYETLFSMF